MNDSRPTERVRPSSARRGRARSSRACSTLRSTLLGDVPATFAGSAVWPHRAGRPAGLSAPRSSPTLAREAWAFLAERKPGAPKIRFESPPASAGDRLKSISVIEIVNDDMPFLVDSVMGELTERGLDVRLVAHPIFAVERDADGKLAGAAGRTRGDGDRRRCAKASSTSMSSASTTTRSATRSCRRSSRCWPTCGSACRTGGRCWRASAR